jgi:hypothetical protein
VDQENVLIGGGLGLEEIFWSGYTIRDQAIADAAVFLGGKDVGADGEEIRVAIDELEGEHGEPFIIRQHDVR